MSGRGKGPSLVQQKTLSDPRSPKTMAAVPKTFPTRASFVFVFFVNKLDFFTF